MEILSFDVVSRYFCIFQKECLSLPQIHAYFHYFLSVREEVYDSQNFFLGLTLLQPVNTWILVIRYTYSLTQFTACIPTYAYRIHLPWLMQPRCHDDYDVFSISLPHYWHESHFLDHITQYLRHAFQQMQMVPSLPWQVLDDSQNAL